MAISKSTLGLSALGGGGAIDIFKPDITWFLNGCPSPRPDGVDELVTAAVVLLFLLAWHWLINEDPSLAKDITTTGDTSNAQQ